MLFNNIKITMRAIYMAGITTTQSNVLLKLFFLLEVAFAVLGEISNSEICRS